MLLDGAQTVGVILASALLLPSFWQKGCEYEGPVDAARRIGVRTVRSRYGHFGLTNQRRQRWWSRADVFVPAEKSAYANEE